MIAFRVDTRCGLGHLMRMKWLALALQQRGQQCHFFLELTALPDSFWQDVPAQLHWLPTELACADEPVDAHWCVTKLAMLSDPADPLLWLVVDGYRFGTAWEAVIVAAGYPLAAIDDLNRPHLAQVIVDAKWQGLATAERYQAAGHAQRLLGPAYAILAPEYVAGVSLQDGAANRQLPLVAPSQDKPTVAAPVQILFALGGGGNWQFLTEVLSLLCQHSGAQQLRLLAVPGPYASATENLLSLSARYPQLQVHPAPASLASYYRQSQLFVGALGTSLYELAATNTPALTFSIAENQQNASADLADLGHYLHLDTLADVTADEFASLILSLVPHLPRLQALRQRAKVHVDGLGTTRIAAHLLGQPMPDAPAVLPAWQPVAEVFSLTSSLELRAVDDSDINAYLAARNRADNSWRMTVTAQIRRIEHYRWWFNQTRQSYALMQDGEVVLYVWHQLRSVGAQHYWIGGWFAASDQVNFSHAQLILEWQLAHTAVLQPDAIWLAVIHKENRFVSLLNQRAGFVALTPDTAAWHATQNFFPQAEQADFHFVGKWPAPEQA